MSDILTGDQIIDQKQKLAYQEFLNSIERSPCGPGREIVKKQRNNPSAHEVLTGYWDGSNADSLHALWKEYSVVYGSSGKTLLTLFPYPAEVQRLYEAGELIKAHDTLYCFLVRMVESFLVREAVNYSPDTIFNPYDAKHYFKIGSRKTFLMCFTKTTDWPWRRLDSEDLCCVSVQDHAIFPDDDTLMAKFRKIIRMDKKTFLKCPFHKSSSVSQDYPAEIEGGAEFSEMHFTRRDDRPFGQEPGSRLIYKQLAGLGENNNLTLDKLEKITIDEFKTLIVNNL